MAPREDLISSAVTFLQDPSVSASALDKRIAFLQSKNLTQEEIDIALARAGEEHSSAPTSAPPANYGAQQQQQVYRPPPTYPGNTYGYPPFGWQPPPPEVPKRDWRDWFIMATVTAGVSYGLYTVIKRYVAPIVAPPTPPQIEQDKAAIDAEFAKAFALIDQLSADTATLKSAEETRSEKLDAALREVEYVVSELKSASRRRDDEGRRLADEVRHLKDQIPKALEGSKEGSDKRLKELGTELRSLKTLMGNRLGGSVAPPSTTTTTTPTPGQTASRTPYNGPGNVVGTASSPSLPRDGGETSATSSVNGAASEEQQQQQQPNTNGSSANGVQSSPSTMQPYVSSPRRENPSPFPSSGGTGRAIPAWQMAASKKSAGTAAGGNNIPPETKNSSEEDKSVSGTVA